jgi:hypothetical protein
MAEEACDEAGKNGEHSYIAWALGIIVWLIVWLVICLGYLRFLFSYETLWFLIPFALCSILMVLGGINARKKAQLTYPLEAQKTEEGKIECERESFKWISTYMANLLLAITIVIPIAVYLAGTKNIFTPEWWPFFLFEFLALGIAVGLILPFFWPNKCSWLILLRHIKTVFFLYVIFFFLSGLIVLALNVCNLIK